MEVLCVKFLLTALNAKYIHSNPALYSLRAYAQQQIGAEDVEIAEYTINQSVDEIAASVYEKKPDVIALSCYIWNWRMIQELIGVLGKVLPSAALWLGGPEVSFHTEKLLEQYPQLTGVMVGEGEVTFSELLSYYRGNGLQISLDKIAGIVYRNMQTGNIVRTAGRELTDISGLPFFYDNMEGLPIALCTMNPAAAVRIAAATAFLQLIKKCVCGI